jgi:hypothetical protein
VKLSAFDTAINAGFVDGRPLHIADPEKSAFFVMTEAEFESMTVGEIQGIFRRKHILVTDMHFTPLQFDSRGLSSLTRLSTVTHIQGRVYFLLWFKRYKASIRSIHRPRSDRGIL